MSFIRHGKETNHHSVDSLFLLGIGLISLSLRTLLTDTDKAGLGAGVTELPVSVLLALVVANGTLLELDDVLDGESSGGAADDLLGVLGGLDVLGGCVTLLGLAVATGEEDEALPVLLEALDVGLEALLGKVLAAGVDRDTDGAGELAGDTGGCERVSRAVRDFSNSGSVPFNSTREKPRPARTRRLSVVHISSRPPEHSQYPHTLDGRASHNGAEKVDGAGSDLRSLGDTGIASRLLLARLLRS